MIPSIGNTARALARVVERQEIVAHNLAQANTTGFKAEHLAAHLTPGEAAPVNAHWMDSRQGRLESTGRSLDLALEGPGYLVVETPDGERLTRGGSLERDAEARLTDGDGRPILGYAGPILLEGGSVTIEADGSVLVDGNPAGRLRVVTLSPTGTLLREGDSLYTPGEKPLPAPEGSVSVRQGQLESSNVNPMLSTVDMIAIQRAFSANLQVMKTMDRFMEIASNTVGETR